MEIFTTFDYSNIKNIAIMTPTQKKIIDIIRSKLTFDHHGMIQIIDRETLTDKGGLVVWLFEIKRTYNDPEKDNYYLQYYYQIGKRGSHSRRTRPNEVYSWSEESHGTSDNIKY